MKHYVLVSQSCLKTIVLCLFFSSHVAFRLSAQPSIIDGHEAVDLGLPSGIKWATCNIGASTPEQIGYYFTWGETNSKTSYDIYSHKYFTVDSRVQPYYATIEKQQPWKGAFTKYCTDSNIGYVDGKTELELEDDAAYVNWGHNWRMPTDEEIYELVNMCVWIRATKSGIDGFEVKGPNGNSIFFPFGGYKIDSQITNKNYGYYISSSSYKDRHDRPIGLWLYRGGHITHNMFDRECGYLVRAVSGASNRREMTVEYSFKSEPSGAKVYMDDNLLGTTPFKCTINSGKHLFKVSKDGMVDLVESIDIKANGYNTTYLAKLDYELDSPLEITSVSVSGSLQSHDYVDLGLPSGKKWATCNVGAQSPSEFGDYYSWGEIEPKMIYDISTYKWSHINRYKGDKYNNDDLKTILDMEDDAAYHCYGTSWRIPQYEDYLELIENCTLSWAVLYNIGGALLTSKMNGNTIFFPMAEGQEGTNRVCQNEGLYWTSTSGKSLNARFIHFYYCSHIYVKALGGRYYGISIRPISD